MTTKESHEEKGLIEIVPNVHVCDLCGHDTEGNGNIVDNKLICDYCVSEMLKMGERILFKEK